MIGGSTLNMHPPGPVPTTLVNILPLSLLLDWPVNLSREQRTSYSILIHSCFLLFLAFFLDVSTLEDEEIMLPQKVRSLSPSDAVLYSKRMELSATPL